MEKLRLKITIFILVAMMVCAAVAYIIIATKPVSHTSVQTMKVNNTQYEETPSETKYIQNEINNTIAKKIDIQTDKLEVQSTTKERFNTAMPEEPVITAETASGIVTSDIEKLKNKDPDAILKYFGNSDIFTPDMIADKLAATVVCIVSSEMKDQDIEVVVHICTLDYTKMQLALSEAKQKIQFENPQMSQEDVTKQAKIEVAKGVVTEDYSVHYNIPVIVNKDNGVLVTETLKQAITGNWYNGVGIELQEVDCILNNESND